MTYYLNALPAMQTGMGKWMYLGATCTSMYLLCFVKMHAILSRQCACGISDGQAHAIPLVLTRGRWRQILLRNSANDSGIACMNTSCYSTSIFTQNHLLLPWAILSMKLIHYGIATFTRSDSVVFETWTLTSGQTLATHLRYDLNTLW